MIFNSKYEWGSVAKALHWIMALLILGMIVLGWVAVTYPLSPAKLKLFIWHKSMGLTLLGLVVVRLLWRAVNVTPAMPLAMSRTERTLAHAGHALLYGLMVLMPLSGYVINSTSDFSFRFFGWYRVPNLLAPDKDWQDAAEAVHLAASWVLVLALALHIAAALRHHFVRKDTVLARMLPFHGGRGDA